MDSPKNVVPFRPVTDLKTPTLTPVENNAFNELARQLASRLETERLELDARDKATVISPELFASATDDANPVAPDRRIHIRSRDCARQRTLGVAAHPYAAASQLSPRYLAL